MRRPARKTSTRERRFRGPARGLFYGDLVCNLGDNPGAGVDDGLAVEGKVNPVGCSGLVSDGGCGSRLTGFAAHQNRSDRH